MTEQLNGSKEPRERFKGKMIKSYLSILFGFLLLCLLYLYQNQLTICCDPGNLNPLSTGTLQASALVFTSLRVQSVAQGRKLVVLSW